MTNSTSFLQKHLCSLEPFHPDLGIHYFNWLRDPRNTLFLEARHRPPHLSDIDEFCKTAEAIFCDEEFVGVARLTVDEFHDLGFPFVFVHHEFSGRGIATWASNKMIEIYPHRKYIRTCYSDNIAIQRVFEKSGFEKVAEIPDYYSSGGEFVAKQIWTRDA